MVESTQIFNPLFLKGTSETDIVTVLHPLVDKLQYFSYRQFTEDFIDQVKKEIHKVLKEVNRDCEFNLPTCLKRGWRNESRERRWIQEL